MNQGNYNSVFYQSRRKTSAQLNIANYANYLNEYKNSISTRNVSPNYTSLKGNSNLNNKSPKEINSVNTYTIYPKSLQTSPKSTKNKNQIYVSPYKYIPKPKKEEIDVGDSLSQSINGNQRNQKRYHKSALDNYNSDLTRKEGSKYQDDQQFPKGTLVLPQIVKDKQQKNKELELDGYDPHQTINTQERVDASYEFFQKILKEVRQNSNFKRELEEEYQKTHNRRNKTLDAYDKEFDDNNLDYNKQRDNSFSGMKSVRQSREIGDEFQKKSKLNSLRSPSSKYKRSRVNKTEMANYTEFDEDFDYQRQVSFQNNSRSNERKDNKYDNQDHEKQDNLSDAFLNSFTSKFARSTKNNNIRLQNDQRTQDEIIDDYKKLILSKRSGSSGMGSYQKSKKSSSIQTSPIKLQDLSNKYKLSDLDDKDIGVNDNELEFFNSKAFKKDLLRRYKQILDDKNGIDLSDTKQKAFDLSHTYYSQKLSLLEKQLGKKKAESDELEYKFDETLTSYKLQTASEQTKQKQKRITKQNSNQSNQPNSKELMNQQNTISSENDEELKMEVQLSCNTTNIVQQVQEGKEIKLHCQIQIKSISQPQLRRRSANPVDIIFVVDNTEIIMKDKFWQVQEMIKNIVRELDDKDQMCLLVQNNLSEEFEQLQELSTDNRKNLQRVLENIPTAAQSSMYSLLLHAFKITTQKQDKSRLSHILVFGDSSNIHVYQKINQNLQNQIKTFNMKQTLKNSNSFLFQSSPKVNKNQAGENSTLCKYFSFEPVKNISPLTLTEDIYDLSLAKVDQEDQNSINNTNSNSNSKLNQNYINQNQNLPNDLSSNQSKNDINIQNIVQNSLKDQLQQQKQLQQISQNEQNYQQQHQKRKPEYNKSSKNNLSDIVEQNDEENIQSSRKFLESNPEKKDKLNEIKNLCKEILQQILNIVQIEQLLELRINPVFSDVFKITQISNDKYSHDEENNVFLIKNKIIDKTKIQVTQFEIEAQRQLFGQIIQYSNTNIFDENPIVQSIYAFLNQEIKTDLFLNLNK